MIYTLNPTAYNFALAANITDKTQLWALHRLGEGLTKYGLLSKMKAVYPFVGGTADKHKWNFVNPVDSDAAFRITWTGNWVHNSVGIDPDGSTAIGDTYFDVWTNSMQNNIHLSYYTDDNTLEPNTGGRFTFGSSIDTNRNCSIIINRDVYIVASDIGTDGSIVAMGGSTAIKGFVVGNRTPLPTHRVYLNGILKGSKNEATTGTLYNQNIRFGKVNNSVYTTIRCSFASIGLGLTDTDALNLYNIVQEMNQILNRAV
jgi:hypothetical protein